MKLMVVWVSKVSMPPMPLQVACTPPGNMVVDVRSVRPSQGGYLQLALEQARELTTPHSDICLPVSCLLLGASTS